MKFTGILGAPFLLLLAVTPALGQNVSNTNALEEVVVTARRAAENLQTVPLSITAISSKDIAAAGITRVEDIASLTPGFSFRQSSRGFERPVIRGMSNIQGSPNASFFIDGVFVTGAISSYNLDNVERVEIIRGPQAALFGRSTFAGAINYITRKPTDTFEGNIKVSAGNFNYQDITGWVSGPIVEGKLRFEVNTHYLNKDGQYTNPVSGTNDLGGTRTKSFGGSLNWEPSEWFDATLRANYSVDHDELPAETRIGGPGTGLSGAQVLNCFLPQAGTRRRGYYCGTVPTLNFAASNSINFTQAGLIAGRQVNQFSSNLVLNAHWRDYTFTSTSSLSRESNFGTADQDYSSLRGFGGAFESIGFSGTHYWSQELRVASPRKERFRWLGGVYTFEAIPNPSSLSGSLVANPVAGQPDLPPVITPQAVDSGTKNKAVFALLEFDLLKNLTLTAEGRYAKDEIHTGGRSSFSKSSNSGFVPGSFSAGCTAANTPTPTAPNRQTITCANAYQNNSSFTNFLPRVTATWLQTDAITWYLQYSKGNKPGGFNSDSQNARITPTDRADIATRGLQSYDEEEANSYEFGLKSRLFDRRVQFNTAVYFIDWSNQQLTLNAPVNEEGLPVGATQALYQNSFIANLGKSQVRGVEMEMLAALGSHWDLRMTYAYQDAKIKKFFSSDQADLVFAGPYTGCIAGSQCYANYVAAGDVSGNTLPRVPKNLASVSLTAKYPIGEHSMLRWRTDYSFEGSRFVQVHNLAETGNASVVNMSLGIERDAWSATAWVRNLFDDRTPIDILRYVDPAVFVVVPVQPPLPGTFTATNQRDFAVNLADRRSFGVTLNYRFH